MAWWKSIVSEQDVSTDELAAAIKQNRSATALTIKSARKHKEDSADLLDLSKRALEILKSTERKRKDDES